MSALPLPTAAPVKAPTAGAIENLRERIRTSPAFQAAYKDGQWRAADFLMGVQGGEFLTREDAGRDLFGMALDEIARLPKPDDSILADSSLLAVARFTGFFEALGGHLFEAWKGRHHEQ